MNCSGYIEEYLRYCRDYKRLSVHTVRAYRLDLEKFHQSGMDIREYTEWLTLNVERTSTLRRKIASLKSFFRFLYDKGIVLDNPFVQLRFHFRHERQLPKVISFGNLETLYGYLRQHYSDSSSIFQKEKSLRNLLLIELLLSTGIRISELCQLKIGQIHLDDRIILIHGKGRKERTVYIGSDSTHSLLKDYIGEYCKDEMGYIFVGNTAGSYLQEQSVRVWLRRLSQQLELDAILTPHMFRHTFATMLLESDVDTRYIQHILGHSSISVTQIYTYVSQKKQKEILTERNPLTKIRGTSNES